MDTELPTIIEQNPKASILPKIIFGFLGLVIVAEIIFGIKTLSKTNALSRLTSIGGGRVMLVSGQKSLKVGDDVRVLVRVSSGGHNTVGSDVDIIYDPSFLEATSSANFYKGNIYKQYPIISVNGKKGEIKISAVAPVKTKGFEGVGVLGGIKFKAKKNGETTLRVVFSPQSTTSSTIVEANTAKNVLTAVSNLKLNIGGKSDNKIAQANACFPRVQQQCTDSLGRIGTQWCTTGFDNPSICRSGCFLDQTGNTPGCKVIVVTGHKWSGLLHFVILNLVPKARTCSFQDLLRDSEIGSEWQWCFYLLHYFCLLQLWLPP